MVIAIGIIFLTAFSSTQTVKVEARANLTAYLTVPPTDWYPFGKYVPATTGWYITHTLGWYNVTLMGNLGIGDGSARALNNSSNQDVNYTANNFMAADISTEPWDQSRLTSAPPLYPAPSAAETETNQSTVEAGNVTGTNATNTGITITNATATGSAKNNSSGILDISNSSLKTPEKINLDLTSWLSSEKGGIGNFGSAGTGNRGNTSSGTEGNASTGGGGNVSENATAENVTAAPATTTTPVFSNLGANVPLNDVYHPIILGRPVDDLMYEYPLASSTTMYARLVGLRIAGGPPINMGIGCLGYGY